MASTINASTGPVPLPGVITTGDSSGQLELQANGVTKLTVDSTGVAFSSSVVFGGSSGTAGQVLTSAGAGSPPTWETPAGGSISTNNTSITQSYTIVSGKNGFSVGPVTIATNTYVEVSTDQDWLIAN